MWLHRAGIAILLAMLLPAAAVPAASFPSASLLRQIQGNGWLNLEVSGGRIHLVESRLGNIDSSTQNNGQTEKFTIRTTGTASTVDYHLSTTEEEIAFAVHDRHRIEIRHTAKGDAKITPVRFTQAPEEPITLILGEGAATQVCVAPTLWHLLITRPDESRLHLVPLLNLIREDWHLAETAASMERELLAATAMDRLPDSNHWDMLIEQLADERFSVREAADRQLRSVGPLVLGHLRRLDSKQLDAEQQFRVRRIIRALSLQTGGDTAEGFAMQLVGDLDVWLALLSRDEEPTRRLAARHVEALLGEPIQFDPAADPENRAAQIEQLRARIDSTEAPSRG